MKIGKDFAQSDLEKAEEFNGQFMDVFNKNEHTQVQLLDWSAHFMNDIAVSKDGVIKFLKGLNSSKALGPDVLHPRVLKELATELGPVFAHLFQQSIGTGEIPKEWSLANICPLFKKSDRSLACIYRPVSLTCVPCKLLEHIILWLFADDCVCYRETKDEEDIMKLQRDIDRLGSWARTWGMRFQPVKCNMMQLTRKQIKTIHALYTLEGTDLQNVESIKYLGVTITSDLRWNTHVSNVCTKASRTLGFLRRNVYSCPKEVKEAAYKGLVRPVLDYGSLVWDPPGVVLQEELESVQKRAARFMTGNYNYETGSMTGILGQLKWESFKKRRKDNRLILLYKGLKGKASVPTDNLIPKTRRCRNEHSMAFQTPIANTDIYKGSVFPQTDRDWNALPDSLISSAEDAEDCVAKFTSLVRAKD